VGFIGPKIRTIRGKLTGYLTHALFLRFLRISEWVRIVVFKGNVCTVLSSFGQGVKWKYNGMEKW